MIRDAKIEEIALKHGFTHSSRAALLNGCIHCKVVAALREMAEWEREQSNAERQASTDTVDRNVWGNY